MSIWSNDRIVFISDEYFIIDELKVMYLNEVNVKIIIENIIMKE